MRIWSASEAGSASTARSKFEGIEDEERGETGDDEQGEVERGANAFGHTQSRPRTKRHERGGTTPTHNKAGMITERRRQ